MQLLVSFSTGLSSALTVERVLQRYGPENVHIVFMDTLVEDADNYLFMDDMEQRWLNLYGVGITRLVEGRTPLEVAEKEQIIPNSLIAPCTYILKIAPFMEYVSSLNDPDIAIFIGYDIEEAHRCEPTTAAYAKFGWYVDYPLMWSPMEHRPYEQVCRDDWGIEPPRMYAMGFLHANCGKIGCVKSSQSERLRHLINFPEFYMQTEEWELYMQQKLGVDNTIHRISRHGKQEKVTLRELRQRYNNGDIHPSVLKKLDKLTACFTCGVGDLLNV